MNTVLPQPNCDQLSTLISEECRELEERKKRVSSIIVRGVTARSPAALVPIFDALTSELEVSPIQLSEVVCIDAEKGLFRAKVVEVEARRKLLDAAKNLKNSQQFSSVYINRDLTYKQRQSLMARRMRSLDHNGNHRQATVATVSRRDSVADVGEISGASRVGLRSGSVAAKSKNSLN